MTFGALRSTAFVAFVVGASTWGGDASGQALVVGGGDQEAHEVLTRVVAEALGLPSEVVRIEVLGGLPSEVDSVQVEGGATDRWIATMWGAGGVARRFVRVGTSRSIPVATRTMERGEQVGLQDIRMEERVSWRGVGSTLSDPVGMVTTRVVTAGEPLQEPSVRPPLLFRGGDEIEAVLERAGITMRVQATALRSAREGEAVDVRLTSGKRMSGMAVGPGLVHLIPGGA
jgi:flagella basal body P-ring formation protein FlgA